MNFGMFDYFTQQPPAQADAVADTIANATQQNEPQQEQMGQQIPTGTPSKPNIPGQKAFDPMNALGGYALQGYGFSGSAGTATTSGKLSATQLETLNGALLSNTVGVLYTAVLYYFVVTKREKSWMIKVMGIVAVLADIGGFGIMWYAATRPKPFMEKFDTDITNSYVLYFLLAVNLIELYVDIYLLAKAFSTNDFALLHLPSFRLLNK